MKTFGLITLTSLIGLCWNQSSFAQGIVTLTGQGPGASNEVAIASDQSATLKTYYDSGFANDINWTASYIAIIKDSIQYDIPRNNLTFHHVSQQHIPDLTIAGPAVIKLIMQTEDPNAKAMLTLDIHPRQYPPDKAAVIGPHSGPMHVTMETSTDLVNWGVATNDITYPDSEEARFFRVKLQKDVGP